MALPARFGNGQAAPQRRLMLLSTNLGICGGAEVQVMELAVNLTRRGWAVELVSMLPPQGEIPPEVAQSGVPVTCLRMRRGVPDPRALFRLRTMLRRFRPAVLHCHMTHANLLGRLVQPLYRVPAVISTLHGMQMNSVRGGSTRLRELLHRATDRWTRLTTTVCHAAAAAYVENASVPAPKLKVVHNGVDTRVYRPDPETRERVRRAMGLEGKFVWLAVGRLVRAKAYDVMLHAFARVCETGDKDSVLLICGSGGLQEQVRQTARVLEIEERVRLLGFRPDAGELMRAADGYLMSSDTEGFPLALIQAAASGLPIIATEVGGNAEAVVDGETGFLIPARDAGAMAAAMLRLHALRFADRREMGLRGREHTVAHYDSARIAAYWERIYLDLLNGGDGQVDPPEGPGTRTVTAGVG